MFKKKKEMMNMLGLQYLKPESLRGDFRFSYRYYKGFWAVVSLNTAVLNKYGKEQSNHFLWSTKVRDTPCTNMMFWSPCSRSIAPGAYLTLSLLSTVFSPCT
jgi:hypothetical protein